MDYLGILSSHLDLIVRFYNTTASPLEERKRLIDRSEPPFAPTGNPEDYDGPAYEEEWREADDILRILGQTGLALLAKALRDYLRVFLRNEGQDITEDGDWFKKYKHALQQLAGFSWDASPASYAQLEQINLARNNFFHGETIWDLRPQQDRKHFRKHPTSSFAEPWQVDYWKASEVENDEPFGLNVTHSSLMEHAELVRRFCAYVERHRTVF